MSSVAVRLLYRSLLTVARKFDVNEGAKRSLLRAVYHREPPALIRSAAPFFSVESNVKARFRTSTGVSLSEGFAFLRLFSCMYSYCCLWTNVLDKHQQDTSLKNGAMAIAQIINPNFDSSSFQAELDSLTKRVQSVITYNNKYSNKSNNSNNNNPTEGKSDVMKTLEAINQILYTEEKAGKEVKCLKTPNVRAAALCTLYQALASSLGIQLHPIESSGYFLLKYQPEDQGEIMLIDAYKEGKTMTVEEAVSAEKLKDGNLINLAPRATYLKLMKLIDSAIPAFKRVEFGAYALMYAPSTRVLEEGLEREERKDIIESRKEKEGKKKKENVVKKQESLATRKKGASV